ncbi:hypothetical protein [Glaciecola sp. 1036]|uniref:hypothetical protein n=1 Tax=Alteromonadaceae TaxID=72275 RepID=UPI003D015982
MPLIILKRLFAIALLTTFITNADASDDKTKHKVFTIKADSEDSVVIDVKGSDLNAETIEFSFDDLEDMALVESHLYQLDEETRLKVMNVLENVRENSPDHEMSEEELHKVIVIENGNTMELDSEMVTVKGMKVFRTGGDKDFVFVSGDGKSKIDALVKLIEKADLSYEDLDKLQAALDAKR